MGQWVVTVVSHLSVLGSRGGTREKSTVTAPKRALLNQLLKAGWELDSGFWGNPVLSRPYQPNKGHCLSVLVRYPKSVWTSVSWACRWRESSFGKLKKSSS